LSRDEILDDEYCRAPRFNGQTEDEIPYDGLFIPAGGRDIAVGDGSRSSLSLIERA
jgi:hypothetical protein